MNPEEILKSIVINPRLVKKHTQWGYYIEVPFGPIHMIGLIKNGKGYDLSLYFGDSQQQSREFYRLKPNIERFDFSAWYIEPNFHLVSAHGRNLIWFGTEVSNQEYLDFWTKNQHLLYRHTKVDTQKLVRLLHKQKIIWLDETKEKELQAIFNKDYSLFNIAAGFKLEYHIDEKIIFSSTKKQLNRLLTDKINEGLQFIGENGYGFLNFSNLKIGSTDTYGEDDTPTEEYEGDPPGL